MFEKSFDLSQEMRDAWIQSAGAASPSFIQPSNIILCPWATRIWPENWESSNASKWFIISFPILAAVIRSESESNKMFWKLLRLIEFSVCVRTNRMKYIIPFSLGIFLWENYFWILECYGIVKCRHYMPWAVANRGSIQDMVNRFIFTVINRRWTRA